MTKGELIAAFEDYDDDIEVIVRDVQHPDKTKYFEIGDVSFDGVKDIVVLELGDIVQHG